MPHSFVRWLHQACLDDPDRRRPYAGVYALGPQIEATIGLDGGFDMERISLMIRERYGDAAEDNLIHVVKAEAAWRMEILDMDPEGEILSPELITTCTHTGLDGSSCHRASVPGAARCTDHGGSVLDPNVRRSMLLIAYAKMVQGSAIAVDTLLDVAQFSSNDLARVNAAKEILDRVGLVHEDGAHQQEEKQEATAPHEELMGQLRKQMSTARERLQLVAIPAESTDITDVASD